MHIMCVSASVAFLWMGWGKLGNADFMHIMRVCASVACLWMCWGKEVCHRRLPQKFSKEVSSKRSAKEFRSSEIFAKEVC